jgi:SAM-dependent methyltransferase
MSPPAADRADATASSPVRPSPFRTLAGRARESIHRIRVDRELLRMVEPLKGAVAIEPGGPSALFDRYGSLPIYRSLTAVDTVDFSEQTIWSGQQQTDAPIRRRLIGEAGCIDSFAENSYDALLASHVLEHVANPLGALAAWQRVVRPGGHVLLIMPHREGTFDHRRPITTLQHMREDAERVVQEDDMTHLEEVLRLHDLARDPGAPSRDAFAQRCRDNASLRAMHHHVFDSRTVVETCREAGLVVLGLRAVRPFHIVCLSQVDGDAARALTDERLAEILAQSPFAGDRVAA